MAIVCIIFGIIELIAAIILSVVFHFSDWLSATVTVTYYISAALYFYLASLGLNKLNRSEYETKIFF